MHGTCTEVCELLPGGLLPLLPAVAADFVRCFGGVSRAYAACARGRCPLDSRRGFSPDPEMLRISASPAGGTGDFGAPPLLFLC